MWIIPNNLPNQPNSAFFPFAQASEVSSEALKQQVPTLAQSLMWRSSLSSLPTWYNRWNKVAWLQLLFSRILKPSMQSHFEDEYTASLAVIRANPSATQGNVKELKTQDTFGRIYEKLCIQLDLFGASLKTSKATSTWDMEKFTEAFAIWVTSLRQEYLARRRLALHTREKDSSSSRLMNWPTATTTDVHTANLKSSQQKEGSMHSVTFPKAVAKNWSTPRVGGQESYKTRLARGKDLGLQGEVEIMNEMKSNTWATPQVFDTVDSVRHPNERSEKANKGGCKNLREQVHFPNWATPNTMDSLPPRSYQAALHQATTQRQGRTNPSNLHEQVDPTVKQAYQDATWPTPRTADTEGGQIITEFTNGSFRSFRQTSNQWFGAKLRDAVENFPTPATRDYKAPNSAEHLMKEEDSQIQRNHTGQLPNFVLRGQLDQVKNNIDGRNHGRYSAEKPLVCSNSMYRSILKAYRRGKLSYLPVMQVPTQLNPKWVCQLMGTTFEQTFFAHLVMPLSAKQHKKLG